MTITKEQGFSLKLLTSPSRNQTEYVRHEHRTYGSQFVSNRTEFELLLIIVLSNMFARFSEERF